MPNSTAGYQVLFSFGGENGSSPVSALSPLNARSTTLYGTTKAGGAYNLGLVYEITAAGHQQLLYSFGHGESGFTPNAPLTALDGSLYGTTTYGSGRCTKHHAGCGAVFAIDGSGNERLVYAFKGGPDGAQPDAALTVVNGVLYGTTMRGGKYGVGTAFSVTTSGKEAVIHSFIKPGGIHPAARLTNANGLLYGTTEYGGKYAYGVVFSMTTSGKEHVLHSFKGAPDGAYPAAGLTDVNGKLYGTTAGGGSSTQHCTHYNGYFLGGCGTIFSIEPSGRETVVYRFRGAPVDGATPYATLLNVNGTLYGTTSLGGVGYGCSVGAGSGGCGTVFALYDLNEEKVVYTFLGATHSDGQYPYADLVEVRGTLYGTTDSGGALACGCGTVFAISPSRQR
jgi:uncharacterized repeat protein (TIGR03803 family)